MMSTIKTIRVWHTDVVEIEWTRAARGVGQDVFIERRTVPSDVAWRASDGKEPPLSAEGEMVGWSETREKS